MNATDSLLIPLADAGRLNGLTQGALGARFRFWRDENGARHVFSVYPADAAPDYPEAVAVVARRTPAGPMAMWAGPAGEPARRAAERLDAEEIHIHVLGEDPPESLRRLLTPRAAEMAPSAPRSPGFLPARRHAA